VANAAALIKESIWRDKDFRSLSRDAQCTYLQLVSQKDLDCAGLLTLHISFLTKGCNELDEVDIRRDLEMLQERRFVFFDEDTDELFIRGYMRTAGVVKSPNVFKSALKSAGMVSSDKLRNEVATELRRLGRKEASELADDLNPSETLRPDPTNPSGTRTLSEPSSTGTVTGTGICSVVGEVGEEPSPYCPQHPNDTDTKCFACGQARRTYPDRKAKWDFERQEAAALSRQAAINACRLCDEFGEITFDDSVRKCNHQEAVNG
jgi:hypothetical protein